jgi:hydroxyethylthiazole kinase-like uncharacterized protein yjeF
MRQVTICISAGLEYPNSLDSFAGEGEAMKLVNVDTMRVIEKEAVEQGLSYEMMMENAGNGLGQWVDVNLSGKQVKVVTGLVGPGNNGGDTLIALEYLASRGWVVYAYLTRPRPENDPLVGRLIKAGGRLISFDQDTNFSMLREIIEESGVLLDGVLGTGFHLPLKPEVGIVIAQARTAILAREGIHVVAVDCPSGVDCDSGQAAPETITANTTVCMAAVKVGLLQFPAFPLAGNLVVVGIGLLEDWPVYSQVNQYMVDEAMVRAILPVRPADAHKGSFGTVMVAAGSINYTGAALLSGKAAYRAGAGLVTMAVPSPLYPVLAGHFPEGTWLLLPHEQGVFSPGAVGLIQKNIEKVTTLLLGPGWGLEEPTLKFLTRLLGVDTSPRRGGAGFVPANMTSQAAPAGTALPAMVVDADGLKLLARIDHWYERLPKLTVLTPHPGEMSVLCGISKEVIQADRLTIAKQFSQKWGHVLVLKGALTVVAAPDGRLSIIPVATPALARAGTGDVLAGVIAGLRAGGVEAFEAAEAGAWIHAEAGLLAAKKLGNTASVMAGDVLDAISGVISRLMPF